MFNQFFLNRDALEEFFRVNYPNVNFAFDGQKNIFTTAYLRGVCILKTKITV